MPLSLFILQNSSDTQNCSLNHNFQAWNETYGNTDCSTAISPLKLNYGLSVHRRLLSRDLMLTRLKSWMSGICFGATLSTFQRWTFLKFICLKGSLLLDVFQVILILVKHGWSRIVSQIFKMSKMVDVHDGIHPQLRLAKLVYCYIFSHP